MTDVAYLCNNCGSVHEVDSIRANLILDLRTAASYELSGHPGMLDARTRFLRWRMTRGLAQALWPGYSRYPWLGWSRRLVHLPSAPVSDRTASTPPPRSPAKTMISQSEAASSLIRLSTSPRCRSNGGALKGA